MNPDQLCLGSFVLWEDLKQTGYEQCSFVDPITNYSETISCSNHICKEEKKIAVLNMIIIVVAITKD